jgi:hypothetical protein
MYYDRRYRRRYRGPLSSLAGGIFIICLALAFFFQSQFGGGWFLPLIFIGLAFSILIGSIGSLNPRGIYGGLYGFSWMIVLALFFITGSWIWFLVGAGISIILGALARPLMAGLLGAGIFAATQAGQQPYQQPYRQGQQPPYQPPYQPGQEPYQSYQQGYQPMQPPPAPGTYDQGSQQYQYPPQEAQPKQQYEAPETQYPQEMPPQQQ